MSQQPFLDIHYQYQVLDIIKWLHEEYQMTIIMVLHDINQAIEYSDELICLGNKGLLAQGRPKDIIDHTLIQDMYHIDAKILQDPDCGTVIVKTRRTQQMKLVLRLCQIILIAVIVISVYQIYHLHLADKQAEERYKNLQQNYTTQSANNEVRPQFTIRTSEQGYCWLDSP